MKINICLCTFRRPGVVDTLHSVDALDVPQGASVEIIVIDNDHEPSGRDVVERAVAGMRLPVRYVHAPAANISIARNAGLDAADGDWIAMLDDDETVPPDWLEALFRRQQETDADAVFGHSHAQYGDDAPDWITRYDYHSQIRKPRKGSITSGHTCNALMRWGNVPWRDERFDIARGRSGGEDVEYFNRLYLRGACYAIADDANAYEPVPANRLTFGWLRKRRYRVGQSYASAARTAPARVKLFFAAAAKMVVSYIMALITAYSRPRRNFWLLRGTMHAGVCAGCLSLPQPRLYGDG